MRKFIAVAIAILAPFLGLSGVGQAQPAAELQGTIEAIDCEAGSVTLGYAGNAETIDASDTTAVAVGGSAIPFCALEGYIGAPAAAWVMPYGDQILATQIEVTGPVAIVAVPAAAIAPLPIVGGVLGTVVYDGLLYLLVDDGGVYYRYPYYGAYYHHYYNARYRPYRGWYPASALVVSAAQAITGTILGTVTVDHQPYLAVRDRDGQFRRYPYYGPYRSYYDEHYRPTSRPYTGAFAGTAVRAPVALGDPHWDAPEYTMQRLSQTIRPSASRPTPWSAPRRPAPPASGRPVQSRPVVPWAQPGQRQPQPQAPAPASQRPPVQQPQARPILTRPQVQPQPQFERSPVRPQPQVQPQQVQRPRVERPQVQRPQVQPQSQFRPHQQSRPAGSGAGQGPARQQQCDPRPGQDCSRER